MEPLIVGLPVYNTPNLAGSKCVNIEYSMDQGCGEWGGGGVATRGGSPERSDRQLTDGMFGGGGGIEQPRRTG